MFFSTLSINFEGTQPISTASTIKDQSNTIKELRLLLARQIEWNQDQCRLLARAIKSQEANEKCDHITRNN